MTTKIERMQLDALEQLARAVERERAAAAERDALAAACRDVGVSVNRMSAKVGVSRGQIYTWLRSVMPSGGDAGASRSTKESADKSTETAAPSRRRGQPKRDT